MLAQQQIEPEIEFPDSMNFLLTESARLKILYGGRGAGKTENIARALIILSLAKKLRIACFRELQSSIAESVHETLKYAISDMNLEDEFNINDKNIICKRTGSEFIFSGLRYNINKIKSLARIDIAWIEEAVNVSKTSWEKLGPTIRGRHIDDPAGMGGPFGKGPEIWISFNPELDTDETYKRYVLQRIKYAPEYITNEKGEQERYAIVCKVNWSDNKWFPPDLEREMLVLKAADEDEWLHVWEGNTKQVLDGAIYAEEIKKVLLEKRRGIVRYDDTRPVYTFWDLGSNDHTAIWFIQRVGIEYNIINYFQDRLKKVPYYIEQLQNFKYSYGMHHLPHDGDYETLAARSIAHQLRKAYPDKVRIIPRVAKKVMGIRAARLVFDFCNFDEENTADGWQCLCRYQYAVDDDGNFSKEPAHNEYSHGADAFQTFALSLKTETDAKKPKTRTVSTGKVVSIRSSSGWMGS